MRLLILGFTARRAFQLQVLLNVSFCHRFVYSSGHHGTFNLAVITNKEDMQISEGVISLKLSALADNTLLALHNSSYHTQPRPRIADYAAFSSRQLKQNRWIFVLFIVT